MQLLFKDLKRGRNHQGGTYGLGDKSETFKTQKYQHCQRDPIIIRGKDNIHPNHLVYRSKDL